MLYVYLMREISKLRSASILKPQPAIATCQKHNLMTTELSQTKHIHRKLATRCLVRQVPHLQRGRLHQQNIMRTSL
jgi:hypothetical protein